MARLKELADLNELSLSGVTEEIRYTNMRIIDLRRRIDQHDFSGGPECMKRAKRTIETLHQTLNVLSERKEHLCKLI